MALQLRRGTDAERLSFIPAAGELIYVTDTNEVWVGDGSTLGGYTVTGVVEAGLMAVSEDAAPALGGNLDLNGYAVTGGGDIDIAGGASIASNVTVGTDLLNELVVNSSVSTLIPIEGSELGSEGTAWSSVYATSVVADSISTETITLDGSIQLQARALYDSTTDTVAASNAVVDVISTLTPSGSLTITSNVSVLAGVDAVAMALQSEVATPSTVLGDSGTTYFVTSGAETTTLDDTDTDIIKMLVAKDVSAGPMTVTVVSAGWTGASGTITFDTNGQGCTLQFIEDAWYCVGNNGAVFA